MTTGKTYINLLLCHVAEFETERTCSCFQHKQHIVLCSPACWLATHQGQPFLPVASALQVTLQAGIGSETSWPFLNLHRGFVVWPCRKNAPGALCVVDGQEVTRERKLLAWAGDMAVQRGELRRTRMELAQAREEIRVLRAELSVLRMEVRGSLGAGGLCVLGVS